MKDLTGIATWNYAWGSLAERIERFAAMGYNAVSLIASDARALADGLMPDVDDVIRRHSLNVAIHGGIARAPEDETVSDFQAWLRWHERTGLLRTVNYDAARSEEPDGSRGYDSGYMRRVLHTLLELSADTGVTVGVEDWPRTAEHMSTVEDLLAYPHYGVLIDLGHLNMRIRGNGDLDGASFADAASAYLAGFTLPVNELHVHNNNGQKDQHGPPAVGTADMAALARMLGTMNVRGPSTIEIVPGWCGLSEEEGWDAAGESLKYWRELSANGDDG